MSAEYRRRHLEITRKHTQRLGRPIGDLFDLSRLESASIKPSLEHFPLENLIRNALKFTPRGGEITISLDPHPDRVAVAVQDTGCGIAESELEGVFDRHYRVDQGEEGGSSSAGLGLAIVRKMLDLHGSRITVRSAVNEGTRFEFDLPVSEAAWAPDQRTANPLSIDAGH